MKKNELQVDPLLVVGDLSVGLSGILPFVTIMLLSRRFGKFKGVKSYWWFFVFGTIGFVGYMAVHWSQRLGVVEFGSSFLAYVAPTLLMIAVADAGGMLLVVRLTGPTPLRLLGVFIMAGLTVPIAVNMFHESMSHTHLISYPMPYIILVQVFMAWLLIAYSYFLLRRLAIFVSARNQMLASIGGFIYIGVGTAFLYTTGAQLYQHISLQEIMFARGVITPIGSLGGLLAFISSLRIASATRAQPSPPVEVEKVKTGVQELDEVLSGGLPHPTSIVVMGGVGSGKTTLVQRMVISRLAEGDGVLYVCLDDTPEDIRESMRLKSFESKPYEEKGYLAFLDAYSTRAGVKSEERYQTTLQLSDISIALSDVLEKLKGNKKHIIIESLTILLNESSSEKGLLFLRTVTAKTRVSRTSLIVSYNPVAFTPAVSALVQEAVDGTIELKIEETRRGLVRLMLVPRLRNTKPLLKWTELK